MSKQPKTYIITSTRPYSGRSHSSKPLTIEEALEYYSYSLECGASYSGKKVYLHPKTIKSLLTSLNNAAENRAANGVGDTYTAVEV